MPVVILEHFEAARFIKRWHYSGTVTKGSHHYFGWLKKKLYAVADYGTPFSISAAKSLQELTGIDDIDLTNLLELKRLCRREPRDGQLSWFLARCHKMLRVMGYKYVISYADPEQGHHGGIYRASNFHHIGMTNWETFTVDEDGKTVHKRTIMHLRKKLGLTPEELRKARGWTKHRAAPKHRYFKEL